MSFVMICGLIGCSNSNESKTEQNDGSSSNEKNHEVSLTHNKKPPSLTITVGEEIIKTQQGGYNWNYFDAKTGQTVGVEAESLPPTEIINVENAVSINLKETIKLNFENEPIKYEIVAYDENNSVFATYNDFKDVKEKGKTVYGIVATWDNGKAIYVVALDIQ